MGGIKSSPFFLDVTRLNLYIDKEILKCYNELTKKEREMIKMIAGYATSRHLLEDRSDRLISIATTVGFGEITYKQKLAKDVGWAVFTDTGVMLVTDIHDSFIVTMYLVSIRQASAIFHGKIPSDLFDIIKRNQKRGLC